MEEFTYIIKFGGGRGDNTWENKTTVTASCISYALEIFEKEYEGSTKGFGPIAVFSVEQEY